MVILEFWNRWLTTLGLRLSYRSSSTHCSSVNRRSLPFRLYAGNLGGISDGGRDTPIITLVKNMADAMVNITGVHSNVSVGWQATSQPAFSTSAGMIYLGLGIVLQRCCFTDKASPDYGTTIPIYAGAHLRHLYLGIAAWCCWTLYLCWSDMLAKRWSTYYQYPNCTIIVMHIEPGISPLSSIRFWMQSACWS